jgi:geranylgeranyl reductase family protein
MRAPNCFDVAVVGAGPAGCVTALNLARNGCSVVMLEKAALPRYKTCGGGVLARAFKQLPSGAETMVERSCNSVALHFLDAGLDFVATRPQPLIYMTMRAELDAWLARNAVQAGARLVESCVVKRVAEQSDHVEIICDRETFRAKFVVAADGIHSVVAKTSGWPELPALAPALEYEITLPDSEFSRWSQVPRFDFNAIEAGYAWIFPKRTHLSAGILSTRRVESNLHEKLAAYLRRLGLTRIEKMEKHGWLIPLAPRRGPLARGRVLLAGDAAGLVDPVTAEGITHALLSGQLAAGALIESGFDVAKVDSLYLSKIQPILDELRAGRFLAKLLYHHPRLRSAAFRLNGRRLCEFVADVVSGERCYRDAVRRPSSYFKLFDLRRAI